MLTLPSNLPGRLLAFRAILAFSLPALLAAQQAAPAPAGDAAAQNPVLRLDPYSVVSKKDYGYRATNASTATGSGEPIINTPLSISILTEDFLKDKNLTELRDALRFVTGTSTDYQQVFGRGFPSVLKNDGSEAADGGTGDFMTYNAERIEIIKGPVSVLQGRASAGGVVNVISRRPKFFNAYELVLGYGSFDRKFGQFRATGPLVDRKLAYLVSYTKLDREGWVKRNAIEDDSIQIALEYRPTEKLTINLDYQQVKRDGYPEQHLSFTNPAFLAANDEAVRLYDALGLARPAASPQIGETTVAWLTRTPGYGPNVPTEVVNVNARMYPDGYRANIQGSQAFETRNRDVGFIEAKYQINDWLDWRSFYYNYNEVFTYARQSTFRPVSALNGLGISDPPQMGDVRNKRYDTIHELVARFSTFGFNHRTLAGFEHREVRSRGMTINGTRVIYNARATTADQKIVSNVLANNPNGFDYTRAFTVGRETSYYFVDQINGFNEHLHLFLGGRQTKSRQGALEKSKFTPQYGVVVRIPNFEGVSFFATKGESFRPNFIADGTGKIVEPTLEDNTEFGIKVDLMDSKISGSASVYDINQTNVPLRDFAREAATGISPLYNVAGSARSQGAEFDLIYTPIRNYQMVFGYSRIWQAETLNAQDVRQIGTRLNGAPEWSVTFWNKYTFADGALKGAYVGFGARFVGEVHVHPSWSAPVYTDGITTGDILVGYPFTLGKVKADVSLRVDNIADKFFYDQGFRPAAGRSYYLSTRLSF